MLKYLYLLDIRPDLNNPEKILNSVAAGAMFRGTNLWILVFATIIASVGLNINSTAVIIGAMLISPLMGPIIATGYAVATHDFTLLLRASKNFIFAILAGLGASALYFTLSPVSSAQSELLSRISPTIYDVIIAFFGGLSGIIAIFSKSKGNIIPGAAIATALLPPLCTAGYGISAMNYSYFFGAFYLFLINAVFISIAAMLATQALRFPIKQIIEDKKRAMINRIIYTIILMTILPSLYFGYELVKKERFTLNSSSYAKSVSVIGNSFLIKSEADQKNNSITLIFGGDALSDSAKKILSDRLMLFNLAGTRLIYREALMYDYLKKNFPGGSDASETNKLRMMLQASELRNDSLKRLPDFGLQLLKEVRVFFPMVSSCSFSFTNIKSADSSYIGSNETLLIVFGTKTRSLTNSQKKGLHTWLQTRLSKKAFVLIFTPTDNFM